MKWSFKIARVFGIDLRLHATFFLIILFGAMQWRHFGTQGMLFGSILMLLLFLCVTLHELGHSVIAQAYGIRVRQIVLLPIGGVAMLDRNPDRPMQELLIAIAGPAVNVVIAALLIAVILWQGIGNGTDFQALLQIASAGPSLDGLLIWLLNANIVLVLFNMIPAFPMDGGRVFRALLGFFMQWGRATSIAAGVGQFLAIGLGLLALLSGNLFLVLIAVFIFFAAGMSRDDVRARIVLSARHIGDVYNKYALTLDESDRVSRVVDYLLTSYQPDFAVVREGELLGVVTREQALASLARSSGDEPVTEVMLREIPGVDRETPLDQVRETMAEKESRLAAVYDRGVFLGLVSSEDLAEAMVVISYEQRRRRMAGLAAEPTPRAIPRPA